MYFFTGTIITEPRFMYVKCDTELARYYRHLAGFEDIPLISQRIDSHISVIRTEELLPTQLLPTTYDGLVIEAFGNPSYVQNNSKHYWFRVISPQLEEIRLSLGFCNQPAEVIDGRIITHPFHLTFGRIKT